jgi:DNA-binding response OmpR family regulator/tetratricopeptide (TPR) repeat protein
MSYRIVVADKDPRSQEAVRRFLPQDNEYIGVSSSSELKQAIKDERPDLIILNAILADSPTWGAVQRVVKGIKGSRDYGDIPVLLMTGDPGSPEGPEVQGFGADGYLSKPIKGDTLKETVESLLGGLEPTMDDEEIMIDFTDDDSGDMTEELLAMSNVALDSEEPSTDVGDTVEIDTGTLVAELDHSGDVAGEDTYEDTVRLNLEDMGLEDELDEGTSFEPTIELMADIPTDFGSDTASGGSEEIEMEIDSEETLPDFSAASREVPPPPGKDSITVDMDMDDLGLDLDTEEPVETTTEKVEQMDVDDAEIGQILEVQEASQVLMSKDLDLDSSLLSKQPTSEVDIIDLEDDTEIRDMDLEELESVQLSTDSVGFDLEDTVPVEDEEMEQLAGEDLGEIDLEDTDEVPALEIESPIEAATAYEGDELSLEEVGDEEEITTQEFFGEELPTEEFPTEKFPEDKTREHVEMPEIDLGHAAAPDEIALAPEPGSQEIPYDEMTLEEGVSGEEALFEQGAEEEPMLEVTEDISFDEITFDEAEQAVEPAAAAHPPAPEPEPAPKAAEPGISIGEAAVGAAAVAAAAAIAGAAIKGAAEAPKPEAPIAGIQPPPPPPVEPVAPQPIPEPAAPPVVPQPAMAPPPAPAPAAVQPAQVAGVSLEQMREMITEIVGAQLAEIRAAVSAKPDLTEPVAAALQDALQKGQFSDSINQAIQAALPSRQEILDDVVRNVSSMLPSRDEVFSKMDDVFASSVPSKETLEEKLDRSITSALPSQDEINSRVDNALAALPNYDAIIDRVDEALKVIPSQEEMDKRFQEALGSLPTPEAMLERIDQALKAIPTPEEINQRFESALSSFPDSTVVMTRIDEALTAIPSQEDINRRFEDALNGLPTREMILDRVDAALGAIPTEEALNKRFDEIAAALPTPETVLGRIDAALAAIPTKEEIQDRFDQIVAALPDPGTILDRIDSALKAFPSGEEIDRRFTEAISAIPSPDEVNRKFDAALEAIPSRTFVKEQLDTNLRAAISPELVAERLDIALRGIPSQEYIRMRLDSAFAALPSPDIVNERLNNALKVLPSQAVIEAKVDSALAAFNAESLMQRIDASLAGLPSSDALMALIEGRVGSMMPGREEIADTFRTLLERRIEQAVSESDLKEQLSELLPSTDKILTTIVTALPEKGRFQETLTHGITEAIQNSLPERTWLESVSRGLFDDRARGMLPKTEEVVELLKEEIRGKLLETVEKTIKSQIEKITSELS